MPIKLLSERTINQIAAGEVVERPISVIKELVENALDAGAKDIKVEIERGGRNLIRVVDNGSGIAKDELNLALQRHATSKLDEDNIADIRHLGFRGEALPAIASVSKMRLISLHHAASDAYVLEASGDERGIIKPTNRGIGTTVEVRDLFCFTPNRLKFLKSEAAETAAAVDLLKKFALQHYDVSFTLSAAGKTLLNVKAGGDATERLRHILGDDFADNTQALDVSDHGMALKGYIGVPTYNMANSMALYLYVNERVVKDKLLAVAVRLGYQDVIPKGRHPAAVLFLQVNPLDLDVNVHPTKSEVRFKDENLVRNFIIKAIRANLRGHDCQVATTVTAGAIAAKQTQLSKYTVQSSMFAPRSAKPQFASSLPVRQYQPYSAPAPEKQEPALQEAAQQIDAETTGYLGTARFQIANTYIVAETDAELVLVDQHAAHERLVLEQMKQQLQKGNVHTQPLLIPHVVQLTEMRAVQVLEHKERLAALGLVLERQGINQILVRSVPAIFGGLDVEQLCHDLIASLEEGEGLSWMDKTVDEIYATMACYASIRAGRKLSIEEMNAILRQMETTPLAAQCNHGRPTVVKFASADLAKMFARG